MRTISKWLTASWGKEPIGCTSLAISAIFGMAATIFSGLTYLQQERFQKNADAHRQADIARDAELRRPRLAENGVHLPNGRPGRTNVTVRNSGEMELAVHDVIFQIKKQFNTPRDSVGYAAGIQTRDIVFEPRHYVPSKKIFRLSLAPPEGIEAGKNLVLRMCISAPGWIGNSYGGNVEIIFDNGQTHTIENVEIDVVDLRA